MKSVFVALFIFTAATVSAEEKPRIDWKPYAALAAGQAFDVWTTKDAFSRGCTEGNVLHGREQPNTRQVIGMKVAVLAPTVLASVMLKKMDHPKIAALFGYGGGAVGVAVGISNLRCGR